jgi:glycosyltransferase involved in cell wall biosynthesis
MYTADNNTDISVVSTGIKNKISQWLGKDLDNINIICNPVKKGQIKQFKNVVDGEKRVILCVGNINAQKNQKMVLMAYELVKKDIEDIQLIFVGGGSKINELKKYFEDNAIKDVTFTGSIDRNDVDQYYKKSSLLVTASIEEGFGLPIIEAYSYGVPVVAFDDIDAIPDLYTEDSMILVRERTVQAFASGIELALKSSWDRLKIIDNADRFSFANIGFRYAKLLKGNVSNKVSVTDIDYITNKSIENIGLW